MKAPAIAYVKPQSLAGAFRLLSQYGEDAKLLAGGQSLLASLGMRLSAPRVLIDINGLSQLAGIEERDGVVHVGALTRHHHVEISPVIAQHVPLLHHAMPHIAHVAIRHRGTLGGSICFADPAAELPACCVALNAWFRIASAEGERRVAARSFFRGLYETDLGPGEILLGAEFPASGAGYRSAFQELARRHGDYAIAGLAAHARAGAGRLGKVSLVYFGVGAMPIMARNAAAALENTEPVASVIARAQAALGEDLEPYSDAQISSAARLHLARVLLGRVVCQLMDAK